MAEKEAKTTISNKDAEPAGFKEKDPVGKAKGTDGPAKTIEEQGIGPRDPYPTGGAGSASSSESGSTDTASGASKPKGS